MILTHYRNTRTLTRKIPNAQGIFAYYWPKTYRPQNRYPSCAVWREEY